MLSNVAASASYTEQGARRRRCRRLRRSATSTTRTWPRRRCRSAAGFFTGDTLAATTTGTSITPSYNASTGVLSLTGSDTLAHYQQVLDSVSYSSSSQNPTNSGADPSRTISWVVNDGTLNSSATQTTTVNITAADDAPVLSNVAACASYTEHGAAVDAVAGATVSDVDNQNLARRRCRSAAGFARPATRWRRRRRHQHHGELQRGDRRADADRQRHAGALPAGARQRHLLVDQRNPTNFGADRAGRSRGWSTTARSTARPRPPRSASRRSDDAPVLSNVAASALLSPSRLRAATLSSGATVSDVDSQNLASATVSISSGLLHRRHAGGDDDRHQHHGELQRVDRRAEPDRQRHAGALPAGARQRQLLVDQPEPDQFRRRSEPHDLVGGQ